MKLTAEQIDCIIPNLDQPVTHDVFLDRILKVDNEGFDFGTTFMYDPKVERELDEFLKQMM